MDYLTDRESAIRKRLAMAQERVALAREVEVALTQELHDVLQSQRQAQGLLPAQSQINEDVEQYSEAVEQPDPPPSKAYLLIDPTDSEVVTPTLDPRFDQVKGSPVGDGAFSKVFLRKVFFAQSRYPIRHSTLRHPKAATCLIKQRCRHWRLVEKNISQTREKWDIDIQCTVISADFVARGDTGYSGVKMFDEDEAESEKITTLPCRIFNYLQLDFHAIEERWYKVLDWHLHEPDSAGFGGDKVHRLKVMDQFGRPIFDNLEQAYP
ncbi:uncharacterized protein FFB14_07260 [Fusarium fujikuroi]|nr:uncharacterized protein FFB14_07260 [Fusarium fujikuroi]